MFLRENISVLNDINVHVCAAGDIKESFDVLPYEVVEEVHLGILGRFV